MKERKKQLHRLSNKDYVNMTADCITCGKNIKIVFKGYRYGRAKNPTVRCATATRADNKRGVMRLRLLVNKYKIEKGCFICGFNKHYAALDFHHKNRKTKDDNIAGFYNRRMEKRMWKEIKKCEVICSNCHRMLHAPDGAMPL